ncbi:ferredoxin reductase family protein [Streptomyces sp. NY05-11A]|uniref:ferredoxin reductase family protein n=1 Tax=Streptomyces soliscabiei TaxID=588897 RepID=UPI0029AA3226|nr:ferredoxin reductase family protein [Streptomyces sp. NY05-11A]MDX2675378.1 ferredoxin reductase family protein [Streptomyces sp. NY05-11A]
MTTVLPPPAGGPPPVATEQAAHPAEGNRLLVLIGFWGLLTASVALWWFNTPAGSVTGVAGALTAAGRITGMAGGFVLLVQVLMMSRVRWLEEWVGAHDLTIWHRGLGAMTTVLILAHTMLIIEGYALSSRISFGSQTWMMLTTYEDTAGAFAATGILVAIALLAVRAIRRRMRYELWHALHLTTYLVLLLGYGHQFSLGSDLQAPVARLYWTALYAGTIACLAWGRILEPLLLNLRHRLTVAAVVPESDTVFSVYVRGRRLDRLEARAGQYFRWRFLTSEGWWQSHPFSLSSAPNGRWLRLTVNPVGDHTTRMRSLRPGTRVIAEGPFGTFTADRRRQPTALLIAAGSGIAPVRSLLERMPRETVLIYRARTAEDVVFGDELDDLAVRRSARVHYVLGSREEYRPKSLLTPEGMRDLVPDAFRRDVYLCGPPSFVSATLRVLEQLGVQESQIHLDPFEF